MTFRAPVHAASIGRAVPLPRRWSVRAADVLALALGNGLLIALMWVRHGGPDQLDSPAGWLTAVGQLTALFGTYLILIELILMSRSPWLDQLFGMDRLAAAHHWIGFGAVWLLLAHGVTTIGGYGLGDGQNAIAEAWILATTYPFVLWAVAGMALFGAVAVSSIRAARRRVSYETWHGIHLYAYLAVALTFAHQLVVGADFSDDPVARLYWIALYVATAGIILAFRFGQPIRLSLRHRLRVANVVREGPGVVSIYLAGRDIDRLAIRSGQYLNLRFLTRDGWWRGHPFSISAAPNGQWLRVTVKDLGDDSAGLQRIPVGTRVYAEGPYGGLTDTRRTRSRVLLIAGGIGITPLRALLEELPVRRGEMTLIYRARRPQDVVFRAELDAIARLNGATVHYLVGQRGTPAVPDDPLGPASLSSLVPDARERDVYLCGPEPMMEAVRRTLRVLGVPARQIHSERFAF
ncbi:MAG: ferredoxin reductase family protein [Chloroflexota bacterium]